MSFFLFNLDEAVNIDDTINCNIFESFKPPMCPRMLKCTVLKDVIRLAFGLRLPVKYTSMNL